MPSSDLPTRNFFDMLNQLGSLKTVEAKDHGFCQMIRTEKSPWPRWFYALNLEDHQEEKLTNLDELMCEQGAPRMIIQDDNISDNQLVEELYLKKNIRKIDEWKGMIKEGGLGQLNAGDQVTVETVNSASIVPWSSIVSEVLFRGEPFDPVFLNDLIALPEVRAHLAFQNGLPVATSMTYTSENTTGIYMVACIESARNKGIATSLLSKVIREIPANQQVVLQSTRKAVEMYRRLGFRECCTFDLFIHLNPLRKG